MFKLFFVCLCSIGVLFSPLTASAQTQMEPLRSFDELFPGLREDWRERVFTEEGLILSHDKNAPLLLAPASGSEITLHRDVMRSGPTYLTESLLVLPYPDRPLNRLDAYNALGKVSGLQGRLYHSFTRDEEVPLFEEATRLASDRRTSAIPDPPPARELPSSETVYIRLRDINFGNSYYRTNFRANQYGVTYNITNNRNLTYLFFTVMREERFNAILYLEPLEEGMLIYSVAGAEASDFVANRIDIPSAVSKRLAVFIGWVSDGLNNL